MIQYIKCLSSFNLIALANQVVGNLLAPVDLDVEHELEQLYKWRSLKDGFEEAKFTRKPICLFIHKLWCPACQKLKAKLSKSMRLIDLSNRFVMIKLEVSKDTSLDEERFQPDGKYVPRILFFTSNGDFIEEAYNRHPRAEDKHKYFYSSPVQLVDTMLFVLKNFSTVSISETLEGMRNMNQIPTNICELEDDIVDKSRPY